MREIKFRAWDGGKFYEPAYYAGRWFRDYRDLEDCIETNDAIMQFTALKDKNGVEIYEGDIVRNCYGELIKVTYGIQEIDAFEGIGFNLWDFYGGDNGKGTAMRLQESIEVVGNIYQNKNLLE